MDLKIAHTTNKLIDTNLVDKRVEYKNIEDLQNDRGRINYNLSDNDMRYYAENKNKKN